MERLRVSLMQICKNVDGSACRNSFRGSREGKLAVAGQLATPPMRLFARRVEHPLDVTVQRSNYADAREHRWTVMFCNQQKRPHRGACHSAPCSALGRSLPLL